MISILLPSRGRPENMHRVVQSAKTTADGELEFIFYLDDDDIPSHEVAKQLGVVHIIGPRILLSSMWNECWKISTADIAMHCGDDIIFRTHGWDTMVKNAFLPYPDRIVLVHGADGYQNQNLASHGFLHRRWVETLGYFVPPYFASDYNDLWLTEIAGAINRRIYLGDVSTEHMHWCVGKGPMDQTHKERLERHNKEGCDGIWRDTAPLRAADIEKLKAAIHNFQQAAA